MKKVKILKKPRKSKIKIDNKPIKRNNVKTPPKQSAAEQNYLKFYDDIKTPNQIYDW